MNGTPARRMLPVPTCRTAASRASDRRVYIARQARPKADNPKTRDRLRQAYEVCHRKFRRAAPIDSNSSHE